MRKPVSAFSRYALASEIKVSQALEGFFPKLVLSPQGHREALLWDVRASQPLASYFEGGGKVFEQTLGKKAVQDMSTEEFARSLANRADRKFEGIGPEVGKLKHTFAKKLGLRYQRMTGDKAELMFERRFIKQREWGDGDGLKGSVVPDVYDPITHEVFDYKFGGAHLGKRQITNTTATMPLAGEEKIAVKMTEIKPQ
mgnify:CR=1 FL=1